MDIYPTVLDLASTAPPENQPLDGVSLTPLFRDPQAGLPRDTLYWHLPHYHHSTPASAIRRGDWKLIEFFEDGAFELYNLRNDPSERTNLANREPATAGELRAALAAWRSKVGAQMPKPNPNHDPARATELSGRRQNSQ
jgi:uncharacterized sulfatase